MANNEESYITHCKRLIEEKLAWQPSNQWKQRDYLNLIGLVENKTGIGLSLSTIKRIWKPNYHGTPHPATLEAFARFLDYETWLDFKAAYPSKTAKTSPPPSEKKLRYNKAKVIAPLTLLFLLALALVMLIQSNKVIKPSGRVSFQPEEVIFTSNNSVSRGVPNTVIFNYDVSAAKADSFFIQQSWNRFRRDKILQEDTTLTSIYYYPGVHKAKLIANDSVMRETTVRVHTEGWLSVARYSLMDDIPVYIRNHDLVKAGILQVSKDHLHANRVDITKNIIVSYYYIDEFKQVGSGDFTLETRIRNDSILNLTCPLITIRVLGEDGFHAVPLTTKGCVGNLSVKLGEVIKSGKRHDLSAFGVDVYSWQSIRINVRNSVATVFLNKAEVFEVAFSQDVGEVVGFNIDFSGSGSLDYLVLYDERRNKMVYRTDFGG